MERKDVYEALRGACIDNLDFEVKTLIENFRGNELKKATERRVAGEPLQYILGEWDFYDMTFKVGPGVLIPRGDTERLCDVAIEKLKDIDRPVVLDLCAGSGCISGVLLKHTDATVTAVEKSEEAYSYLTQNLSGFGNRCKILLGDAVEQKFDTLFDMVVSNPPYISASEYKNLDESLKFEPEMALIAPENGLYFYREIAYIYKKYIKPGGYLIFEIGYEMREQVTAILQQNGYKNIQCVIDFGGNDRVVLGQA